MPPDSVRLITSPAIIHILCDMLAQSAQYPILANEAIIALALLATFGVEEAGEHTLSTRDKRRRCLLMVSRS